VAGAHHSSHQQWIKVDFHRFFRWNKAVRYSLDQLNTFATVVESGSFSAAARRLSRTQSSVSTAIANLEADLRVELFDRSTRVPRLTPAGQALQREVADVLERCLELDRHALSLSQAVESVLELAIEVPHTALMPPLAGFAERFPFVDLNVRHPLQGNVSALVAQGDVALGIAFSQPNYARELGFVQMGKLVMAHVAAASHPLGQQARVGFGDLRRHRRLAFSAHSERLPSSEYLGSTRRWQAESHSALLEMARAGLGWATLPRLLVRRELAAGELVELRLEAYPHTDWLIGVDLLWNKSRALGPAASWLREALGRFKISELDSMGHPTTF
jgi:DNA-binding transcriptional LysR family regulator